MRLDAHLHCYCSHTARPLAGAAWAPEVATPHNVCLDPLLAPGAYPVSAQARFGDDVDDDDDEDLMPAFRRCALTGGEWNGFVSPTTTTTLTPVPTVRAMPVSRPSGSVRGGAKVKPLRQPDGSACGQTSVAMGVNSLTGKKLTGTDIANRYGYSLLTALNSESRGSGYRWRDGGNFSKKSWPTLEKKLNREHTPVLIGLNGPLFSPSGRGHIVTLLEIQGEKVRYADPADGTVKTTTRRAIEQAGAHPDGKFMFYANRGV